MASTSHHVQPREQYRVSLGGVFGRRGGGAGGAVTPENAPEHPVGANPPGGVRVQYWLGQPGHVVELAFTDAAGKTVASFSSTQDSATAADSVRRAEMRRSREDSLKAAGIAPDSVKKLMRQSTDAPSQSAGDDEEGYRPTPAPRAPNKAGVNTFFWNMRYPEPHAFRGMILWAAGVFGPMAPPGTYAVRLTVDGKPVATDRFKLMGDPRVKGVTQADYAEQFAFLRKIEGRFSEANDGVKTIRWVRHELEDRKAKLPAAQQASFGVAATALDEALTQVEDSLYQTQNRANEDPLNYPIRLNNKIGALMGVVGSSDNRPTAQSYAVFNELSAQLDVELGRLKRTLDAGLPHVNSTLTAAGLPPIVAEPKEVPVRREGGEAAAGGR
jgi:hypothetical protein